MSTFLTFSGLILFSAMFGMAGVKLFDNGYSYFWGILTVVGIILYVTGMTMP